MAGDLSLDQFTDWYVGASWNIDQVTSPMAYELASAIELALAEASSGLLTHDELDAELMSLATQPQIRAEMVHEAKTR